MRTGLILVLALLTAPAWAVELGEDFGSTADYGIEHDGGDAIATIGKIAPSATGIVVDVRWDAETDDWVDSFTVVCPGNGGTAGVADNAEGGVFFDPAVSGEPPEGQLRLQRELYVRVCQIAL